MPYSPARRRRPPPRPHVQLPAVPDKSPMRDLSLHLFKNSFVSKMKKGIRAFCHGVGSTSTLKQRSTFIGSNGAADVQTTTTATDGTATGRDVEDEGEEESSIEDDEPDTAGAPLTLEEMIRRLDMEEEAARRERELQQLRLHADDYHSYYCCYSRGSPVAPRRMSCVNASSTDALRWVRDAAMSQYPRFSLDGRDAMYRSSFRTTPGPHGWTPERARRSSATCSGVGAAMHREQRTKPAATLPHTVAGQNVVWCRPGVVPKLMGLEAVPVPVRPRHCRRRHGHHQDGRTCRKYSQRRAELQERARNSMKPQGHAAGCIGKAKRSRDTLGMGSSCTGGACCAGRELEGKPTVDLLINSAAEDFWNFSMYNNYYN